MAFLNPKTLLCYRHQSALLFCKAVRTVVASSSSDPPPLKLSGPIQYVQKQLTNDDPECNGKSGLETRENFFGSILSDSWKDENKRKPSAPKKRGNLSSTSRGTGSKTSSDSRLSTAFPATVGNSTRRPHLSRKDEVQEGGQDTTTNLELDGAGESLFGDTLKTHTENLQLPENRGQITDKDARTSARNYVMGLLSRGLQTESNLRSKLIRKNIPADVIDEIINNIQRCGLQCDQEYAEAFARSRWTDNTWGPKRIKYELLRKGICKETVEATVVTLFETSDMADSQEEEEDLGKWGMTTEAAEHLIGHARRKWHQGGEVKIEVKRRRMIGWLQRRGFSWSIILEILKLMESE